MNSNFIEATMTKYEYSEFERLLSVDSGKIYTLYDKQGRCIYEVDKNGMITCHNYLVPGLIERSLTYCNKINVDSWDKSLQSLLKHIETSDFTENYATIHRYDSIGREIKADEGVDQQQNYLGNHSHVLFFNSSNVHAGNDNIDQAQSNLIMDNID